MGEPELGYLEVEGVVRPIVQVGDPVLSTPCAPETAFDNDLMQLLANMFASMYAADGVGMAANQIGVGLQVFVFDCPDADQKFHRGVMINPTLELPEQRPLDEDDEGCLSVRGQFTELARPECATVRRVDHAGKPTEKSGTGLLARCLQHQYDPLQEMLFIDLLSTQKRKKVLSKWRSEHGDSIPQISSGKHSCRAPPSRLHRIQGVRRQSLLPIANLVSAAVTQTRAHGLRRALYRQSGVQVHELAVINGYSRFMGPHIRIGASWVGAGSWLIATPNAEIRIGDNCDIGPDLFVTTGTHHIGPAARRAGPAKEASVTIEDGCWLGARVTILPGVTIGKGSVIAAGSVVTSDVNANCLVAGVPARPVRSLE